MLIQPDETMLDTRRTIEANSGVFEGTAYAKNEKQTVRRFWSNL